MARRSVIGKSAPYQRRNKRIEVPAINLSFRGRRYQTVDWGLGGFRIRNFQGKMKKDEEFELDGIGPADENELMPVRITCRAVRRNIDELACAYVTLSEDAYEILEALMLRRKKHLEQFKLR